MSFENWFIRKTHRHYGDESITSNPTKVSLRFLDDWNVRPKITSNWALITENCDNIIIVMKFNRFESCCEMSKRPLAYYSPNLCTSDSYNSHNSPYANPSKWCDERWPRKKAVQFNYYSIGMCKSSSKWTANSSRIRQIASFFHFN